MEEGSRTVEGVVQSIVFKNDDNGYTVFEVQSGSDRITMVGIVPFLYEGESITATGHWVEHRVYGPQFSVEGFEKGMPVSSGAIFSYLSGGAIKGVGAVTAGRIVELFGDKSLEIIEHDPHQLTRVKGISPAKAQSISKAFTEQFGIRSVLLFFQQYGVTMSQCMKIWKCWGPASVDIIKTNPYLLCEHVDGIGFKMADEIAVQMGFDELSPFRLRAAIRYVLTQNAYNGHTFLPAPQLLDTASGMIGASIEDLAAQLDELVTEGSAVRREIAGRDAVYLTRFFNAELYCALKIKKMLLQGGQVSFNKKLIGKIEKARGIKFNDLQKQAVANAADRGIMVLTGGPGTGKTTTLCGIIELYRQLDVKYALAAPTGRAAKRISELTGHPASTIHRLLEMKYTDDGYPRFMKDENNQLECSAVICDEASMIDIILFEALLKALPEQCRLILVGDADQLPPVGPGNIFGDIIGSKAVPVTALDHIFRQSADSRIITNAHRILAGQQLDFTGSKQDMFMLDCDSVGAAADTVVDLCVRRLKNTYGWDINTDIQILSPSKLGVCGTVNINRRLKEIVNPPRADAVEYEYGPRVFREGDKVMQTRNNYDIDYVTPAGEAGVGIYNGDIGTIVRIMPEYDMMTVDFDGRCANYPLKSLDELDFAYAVTVHKSQGSEFKCVILLLADTPRTLMYRNLLYTAITRAREMLIIVGKRSVADGMIENKTRTRRFSGLKYLLTDPDVKV